MPIETGSQVNIGVVGKGRWAKVHLKTIEEMSGVSLAGQPYGRNLEEKLPRILENRPDAFIVASSTPSHYPVTTKLAENDFPVLVEKPVTQTYSEALRLQELCRKHPDITVMVGHILLYDPHVIELHKSLSRVGKVREINFYGLGSEKVEGATVIQDWGPHPAYLLPFLAGSTPTNVAATQGETDSVHLKLTFPGDVIGNAHIGWTSPKKRREISVIGVKGTLKLDYSNMPKMLTFRDRKNGSEELIYVEDTKWPLENEIRHFVKCLEGEVEPKSPLSQGVEVMKLLDYAQQSLGGNGKLMSVT